MVPVVGAEGDTYALATAFAAAKRVHAHVEALFVRPDPGETLPTLGIGVSGNMLQEIMSTTQESVDQAHRAARHSLETEANAVGATLIERPERVPHLTASFQEETGLPSQVIARRSRLADLVVFVKGGDHGRTALNDVLEEVLLVSGRPILVAPHARVDSLGSKVTLGWDGSAESAHAVTAAIPLLEQADQTYVLNVQDEPLAPEIRQPLSDYLAFHGVVPQEHQVGATGQPIGQVLIGESVQMGCDLLVMGGYGHSRIRERIIGGVTRYVLDHTSLPTLLAH
jgi:nucleotide-binding universal stress UspA family protein